MSEPSDFEIGQTVELSDGRIATVQYVGSTEFATGDWVGVELDESTGKNDGSVQGQRYFDCPAGHGMFVRAAAATVIDQQTPKPAARRTGKANGTTTKARPPSMATGGSRRQSVIDPSAMKRQSINASSPTPAARVSRLTSPSKSPTKQLGSTASSGNSSRMGTPSGTARKSILPPTKPSRTSMGPPPPPSMAKKAPRASIAGTMNGSAKPAGQAVSSLSRGPSNRLSMRPGTKERLGSASGERRASASSGFESPAEALEPELLSPSLSDAQEDPSREEASSSLSHPSKIDRTPSEKPVPVRGRSPTSVSHRPPPIANVSSREVEDLKTKLRLIEKKRAEDREKLKALDKVQADRDKFEGIIQKLQSKYQPQQQEIADLKKQLKEEEAKVQILEAQQAENDTVVEVATLDREMAEETAESLKLELEVLRQKQEEIELEVDVLREENHELGKEISPEEKTSQGWLQLERTNERLREALIRLRDVTQQQEADLKGQIAELEEDAQNAAKLQGEYGTTKERLLQSDATVEDLRQQLDNALGAEDMIEELTEKNLALSEKLDDFRLTIEDLESLKELNDELELNHTENEKQLQDEIEYNETLLAEEARKLAVQDGTIQDLEYTVSRFRELVTNMQTDLEDMKASQQITETEANELSSRSRAMMDLNMRLQNSASKAQVKAIDLELGKMHAQESSEHLAIVQLFLPESFKSENDSVQALLRFRRIGFKANMMYGFVKEKTTSQPASGHEDEFFAFCDVLEKLTWISSTCNRFINSIKTCNLEKFKSLGGASYELEPVERGLNGWIDGVKRDELRGEQCATELQRSIALMTHLAEIHIGDRLDLYADDVHMRALMMQTHLENTAAGLIHIKALSEVKAKSQSSETASDDDVDDQHLELFAKIDALVSQTRSAKVVSSKAVRQLEDLKSRSLTLEPSTLKTVEQCQDSTLDLSSVTREVGISFVKFVTDESRSGPVAGQSLSMALSSGQMSLSPVTPKLQAATAQLQIFYNLTTSLTQTVEFPSPAPPPPWRLLAQNMRAATADLTARETELSRLKDEIAERNTTLAMREKATEEMSVKVEVLEKRVGESSGRKEKVRELESIIGATESKEKELTLKINQLRTELQNSEGEREKWKQTAQAQSSTLQPGQVSASGARGVTTSESSLRQIERLNSEIKSLQSSIRYLRSASHAHSISTSYSFLSNPIAPTSPPPPLVKSEAKEVLKEMLDLITSPENQIVKLEPRAKVDRLRWRPTRETSNWQVQKQREEWEEWREWRDGVAKKSSQARKEQERRKEAKLRTAAGAKDPLARLEVRLPGKIQGDERVRIVKPGEWEDVEEALGFKFG